MLRAPNRLFLLVLCSLVFASGVWAQTAPTISVNEGALSVKTARGEALAGLRLRFNFSDGSRMTGELTAAGQEKASDAAGESGRNGASDAAGLAGTTFAVYQRSNGRAHLMDATHPLLLYPLDNFGSDLFTLMPVARD